MDDVHSELLSAIFQPSSAYRIAIESRMAFIKSLALNGILIAIIAHGLVAISLVWDKVLLRYEESGVLRRLARGDQHLLHNRDLCRSDGFIARSHLAKADFRAFRAGPTRSKAGYMLNRFLAGVGSSLVVFAVSRTSLSMVEAISGTRYVIIFLAAFAIIKSRPSWFREDFTRRALLIKVLRTALVVVGLILASLHGGNTGAGGPSWNLIFLVALTGCVAGSINRPERSNLSKHVFP